MGSASSCVSSQRAFLCAEQAATEKKNPNWSEISSHFMKLIACTMGSFQEMLSQRSKGLPTFHYVCKYVDGYPELPGVPTFHVRMRGFHSMHVFRGF